MRLDTVNNMKTLIINGSPRKNGNTAALTAALTEQLSGSVSEFFSHQSRISSCIDCRICQRQKGCVIRDDMDTIYADDFDNVVIASPIYTSMLPGPLVNIASRFQCYYASRKFLNDPIARRAKKGALLLVGGGDGAPDPAIEFAQHMFRFMKAEFSMDHLVLSHNTDVVPAMEDAAALEKLAEVAAYLNGGARV